ncbi:MAG: hypothetical protein KAR13_08340, partial [Desulfobulbaceae bacterium]|nr:hypothetical protein [Desulfobulbaceae bacterium]
MAIDLTGIINDNEFYTHHYLSAILENDIKDVFSEWKRREQEDGIKPPYTELRNLHKDYFAMQSRLERERRPAQRLQEQELFLERLLAVLGYEYSPQFVELDDNVHLPLIGTINKRNGAPELWLLEALDDSGEDLDPLALTIKEEQYSQGNEDITPVNDDITLEEIITRQIFGRSEPPRWVILAGGTQLLLFDRQKWPEKRLLRFDFKEILGRRETSTLQAMAALLHRDSVCPEDGMSLLDTLDENSHKHAFAVSEDLKYSLR